jgi:histidine triad (HIT) family protein
VSECIFCKIVAGELPSSKVYEDDTLLAFMDINPINEGHTLVIPKEHFVEMADMDEQTGMLLFQATLRLQRAIRDSGVPCEAINLFLADGEAAGQEVPHVHMHIFPRFKGDAFRVHYDWVSKQWPGREQLDATAAGIRNALEVQPGGATA